MALFQGPGYEAQAARKVFVGEKGPYTALYDHFYRNLLATSNSIPIQSLWFALIQPKAGTEEDWVNTPRFKECSQWDIDAGFAISKEFPKAKMGAVGALFAQAVEIPADGINIERAGTPGYTTRFIKGPTSAGRQEYQNLTISFLETDVSFVDYFIRPWMLDVNYNSLKMRQDIPSNRADITIIHLGKTKPGTDMIQRKAYKFIDAAPISVDREEYNYGDDKVIQRAVEFTYNKYVVLDTDVKFEQAMFETVKLERKKLENRGFFDRAIERATDFATGILQSELGIGGPGSEVDRDGNPINRDTPIFAGRVVTNVGGAISGAVEGLIQDAQSSIRGAIGREVSRFNESVNDAIDDLTGTDNNEDTVVDPNTFQDVAAAGGDSLNIPRQTVDGDNLQQVVIEEEDRLRQLREIRDRNPLSDEPGPHFGPIEIPEDDVPNFADPRAQQTKGGQQQIKDAGNGININNDTPFFGKQIPNDVTASEPLADTPRGIDLESDFKKADENDVPTNILAQISDKIDQDDTPEGKSIRSQKEVIDSNDEAVGKNIKHRQVNIDKDDIAEREKIPSQIVNIASNDNVPNDNIPFQNVVISDQESTISDNVKSQLIEVPRNDITVPGEIPIQIV
ncbi:MAG: hypothetical protein ACW99Q_19890, partial [Candidatus Kariarchaeaceae archaeon]